MFLYRQTAASHDMVQLFESFDEACQHARVFVGEHNDIDGCSSRREEQFNGTAFRTYRSTSFGQRRASVRPISSTALIGLD